MEGLFLGWVEYNHVSESVLAGSLEGGPASSDQVWRNCSPHPLRARAPLIRFSGDQGGTHRGSHESLMSATSCLGFKVGGVLLDTRRSGGVLHGSVSFTWAPSVCRTSAVVVGSRLQSVLGSRRGIPKTPALVGIRIVIKDEPSPADFLPICAQ